MSPILRSPILRPGTPEDAPAIAVLMRLSRTVCLPFLPDLHTAAEDLGFVRDHMLPGSAVQVATDAAGGVLGFCAARPGWLDHLYLHPDRRGQGLGSLLLDAARQEMPEMRAWVFLANTPAIGFYQRHGFRLEQTTDGADNEERLPDGLFHWHRAGG